MSGNVCIISNLNLMTLISTASIKYKTITSDSYCIGNQEKNECCYTSSDSCQYISTDM